MMTVTIDSPDLKAFIKDLDNAPQKVKDELRDALRKGAANIQRETISEAPVNDGILRANVRVSFPAQLTAVVASQAEHSAPVHEGTKPHRAPFEPIRKWANKKGIPPGAVWMSIAKKGTKANKFMKRGVDNSRKHIQRYFNTANTNVAKYLAEGK